MKHFAAIALLGILFSTAFVTGQGRPDTPPYGDTLQGFYLYTEGIKQQVIERDTARARELFTQAIAADSTLAPAYFELAVLILDADATHAVELSRRASQLDTANKWYQQLYGQALVTAQRYDEALAVYRRLRRMDPRNPEVYRVLAALYEQAQLPFSAIAVLDSAELRFGRIPPFTFTKRRLLIATRQYDKAITEAEAWVEEAPYEPGNRLILGDLYSKVGRDSQAMAQFEAALRIDSTDLWTLATVADFYNQRQNYPALLGITKKLFESDEVPVKSKIEQFERMTSDLRFYREYYRQLNELAAMLAIKYPNDPEVVELYGQHLITTGELDRALELYKHHTSDRPAVKDYFKMVIDIESYKQRPDSVDKYVSQALQLFPDAPEFYISRGNIYNYGKRYDEAIKSYRASLRHVDTDSLRGLVWGYIGDTYHAAGSLKKTYSAYERSLRYWPENAVVLNNYAYFLALEERDLDRALAMSEQATSLVENNPTYLDTRAWVLHKLGRTDEAKRTMQLAVSLDRADSPELLVHYGDILAAAGERYLAEVYWRKALEKGYEDPAAIERRFEWLARPEPEKTSGQ